MISLLPGLLWIASLSASGAPDAYPQCENPAPDDGRPYMLCVAETESKIADARLNRQWRKTLTEVSRSGGPKARKQLLTRQRTWLRKRDRECNALAASSPVTQSGRNQMSCLTKLTEARTAELTQLAP